MEQILLDIISEVRKKGPLDTKSLTRILHKHNKNLEKGARPYGKKRLLPYIMKVRSEQPELWESWNLDPETERNLLKTVQIKPRRTASGVATITVITKPWPCASECLYCPNDIRMPKSYLSDEPACQRAENNYFDPYLQVTSRLRALTHMGHPTDKIELIVLGGTWSDYPESYQRWFIVELFRALNDEDAEEKAKVRRQFYRDSGLSNEREDLQELVSAKQQEIFDGKSTYNKAAQELYLESDLWQGISAHQDATFEEIKAEHAKNVNGKHRVVGLVIETRPDTVTPQNLTLLRSFGCTKIQIGVQSLNPKILEMNHRTISIAKIQDAFELLRIFGFKIHAHYMLNLYGSNPEHDIKDYQDFVTAKPYQPDEIKLYPCVLVEGTKLCAHYADKTWQPYTEEQLIHVLSQNVLATPPFARISRMIRDISAHDIVAGSKKTNMRQLVENHIKHIGAPVNEIRYREISTSGADSDELTLEILEYETTVSTEYFMQWVTPEYKIAGFLRLSLPHQDYVERRLDELPIRLGEAMIREVHVYGRVAKLHKRADNTAAQHLGLGKRLVAQACEIAAEHGYHAVNVISAVGTRGYYQKLGFTENGLYQTKEL